MKRSSPTRSRPVPVSQRRGVTLVEMLVTVAILVIIMTVLVQVFQAATGAVSGAQAYQQLDDQLRRVDGLLHSDLEGVTARFTPPLDPSLNLGYFEYGENEFADIQGEDSDDYIRFTAKAPEGRPFTGRMWIANSPSGSNPAFQLNSGNANTYPVTVTSDTAEILYFLRNGNLYRRVLLVAPQLQSAVQQTSENKTTRPDGSTDFLFYPTALGGSLYNTATPPVFSPSGNFVSWQGVNDLSAHPNARGNLTSPIVLNTLGDLTNRENRFGNPRFADDFILNTSTPGNGTTAGNITHSSDSLSDDLNEDNIPDLYPSLYPQIFSATDNGTAEQLVFAPPMQVTGTGGITYPTGYTGSYSGNQMIQSPGTFSTLAFPYIFPGAYSVPQQFSGGNYKYGWIHSPTPLVGASGSTITYDTNPLVYLTQMNHNPIDVGDNLSVPQTSAEYQTWWGFPTWRETLSPNWTDPTHQLNTNSGTAQSPSYSQPFGLSYAPMYTQTSPIVLNSALLGNDANLLPPMAESDEFASLYPNNLSTATPIPNSFSVFRRTPQLFSDSSMNIGKVGDHSVFWLDAAKQNLNEALWSQSWEDDLIMTNVRSFDVKALDQGLGTYADLGWGDDPRLTLSLAPAPNNKLYLGAGTGTNAQPLIAGAPYLQGNWDVSTNSYASPAYGFINVPSSATANTAKTKGHQQVGAYVDIVNTTFAHEGRMPPLYNDYRFDAQYGAASNYLPSNSPFLSIYTGNIGDDSASVVRLRRVWDSWSTEYSRAPGTAVYKNRNALLSSTTPDPLGNSPWGPPFSPPVYPSYPPPYPAPLTGIQIQIRVVDPSNQRVKTLTIRQDFSDKL